MENHSNKVLLVRIKDHGYVGGNDAFYPKVTDNIKEAVRLSTLVDAKKYRDTAVKRLKRTLGGSIESEIVSATEVRDKDFKLVDVYLNCENEGV